MAGGADPEDIGCLRKVAGSLCALIYPQRVWLEWRSVFVAAEMGVAGVDVGVGGCRSSRPSGSGPARAHSGRQIHA